MFDIRQIIKVEDLDSESDDEIKLEESPQVEMAQRKRKVYQCINICSDYYQIHTSNVIRYMPLFLTGVASRTNGIVGKSGVGGIGCQL